jgi:hypothetical protein
MIRSAEMLFLPDTKAEVAIREQSDEIEKLYLDARAALNIFRQATPHQLRGFDNYRDTSQQAANVAYWLFLVYGHTNKPEHDRVYRLPTDSDAVLTFKREPEFGYLWYRLGEPGLRPKIAANGYLPLSGEHASDLTMWGQLDVEGVTGHYKPINGPSADHLGYLASVQAVTAALLDTTRGLLEA